MERIYKNTYKPQFDNKTVIELHKRLNGLKRMTEIPLIHRKICIEIVENEHTTAELHRLAEVDKEFQWLKSQRNKPMSTRQIQNILFSYFPEYKREHRKGKKRPKERKDQIKIKKAMNMGICHKCGSTERLELHHMIPLSIGGTNDPGNVIILCHDCHMEATRYLWNLKRIKDEE